MDPLLILEQVNAFYSNAFSHLITLTLIVLGFGSVAFPIIIQIYQNHSFRIEKENLEKVISESINKKREELKIEIEKYYKDKEEQLKKQFQNEVDKSSIKFLEQESAHKAGIFFLQATIENEKKDYANAVQDYSISSTQAFKGKETLNGQRALDNVVELLPHLDSTSFKKIPNLDQAFDNLLEVLNNVNKDDLITEKIELFISARNDAKNRITKKPKRKAKPTRS
jgi:hypothetical protein